MLLHGYNLLKAAKKITKEYVLLNYYWPTNYISKIGIYTSLECLDVELEINIK